MDSKDFQKFLFKIAFSVIVIDGEIHEDEIDQLKQIDKKTSYFSDTDLSEELGDLINLFKNDGTVIVENILNGIRDLSLNQVQELLVLEVALRIIYADQRFDESEKKFIRLLRSKLKVSNELIRKRFGNIGVLNTEKSDFKNIKATEDQFKKINSIAENQLETLSSINFPISDEQKK
jgi:uncharacterized tellurite resistance protein B-like protein